MSDADFQRLQRVFADHLRNPDTRPAPEGLEERRLDIYRNLFFNNVNGFIQQGFPVLFSLLNPGRWQRLVRGFFESHACKTPYFVEIPQEFVSYLATGAGDEEGDPPFLLELAHYEWMELVLDASTELFPEEGIQPEGDLLRAIPKLSPLHAVLSYHFPVHKICTEFQPDRPLPQPVWLLIYRNREDQVRFMEINAPTARLLQLIAENPALTGIEVVGQLAGEMQFDEDKLAEFSHGILQQMRERDILIGTTLKSC